MNVLQLSNNFFYTGIGSLEPFLYTRSELIQILRTYPLPGDERLSDQELIDDCGAIPLC